MRLGIGRKIADRPIYESGKYLVRENNTIKVSNSPVQSSRSKKKLTKQERVVVMSNEVKDRYNNPDLYVKLEGVNAINTEYPETCIDGVTVWTTNTGILAITHPTWDYTVCYDLLDTQTIDFNEIDSANDTRVRLLPDNTPMKNDGYNYRKIRLYKSNNNVYKMRNKELFKLGGKSYCMKQTDIVPEVDYDGLKTYGLQGYHLFTEEYESDLPFYHNDKMQIRVLGADNQTCEMSFIVFSRKSGSPIIATSNYGHMPFNAYIDILLYLGKTKRDYYNNNIEIEDTMLDEMVVLQFMIRRKIDAPADSVVPDYVDLEVW